jgi:tetrahydromethanopterin S-methyltransferase subunit F
MKDTKQANFSIGITGIPIGFLVGAIVLLVINLIK